MYSSVADVRNAVAPGVIGRDDPATAGTLNEDQITDAINEADSIVDLHVSARYTVEQDPADTSVAKAPFRYMSRNIAAYLITLTYRRTKAVDERDPVELRYRETMAMLVAIRDGNLDVPGATPADSATSEQVFVYNQYEGKMFYPQDMGLGPSPSELNRLWLGSW